MGTLTGTIIFLAVVAIIGIPIEVMIEIEEWKERKEKERRNATLVRTRNG